MARYKTAGREAVISFFRSNPDKQFSAEEIFTELAPVDCDGEKAPGKSSVYRILSRLCDEGIIRRYRDNGKSNCLYQLSKTDDSCDCHFHLKCTECGRVFHLECPHSDDLLSHVRSDHGFKVDPGRSMLYGVCRRCNGGSDD